MVNTVSIKQAVFQTSSRHPNWNVSSTFSYRWPSHTGLRQWPPRRWQESSSNKGRDISTFSSPFVNKYRGPLPAASKNTKLGHGWLPLLLVPQTLDTFLGAHLHEETNFMRSLGWLQSTTLVRTAIIKHPPNKICLHFGPLKNTNWHWGHRWEVPLGHNHMYKREVRHSLQARAQQKAEKKKTAALKYNASMPHRQRYDECHLAFAAKVVCSPAQTLATTHTRAHTNTHTHKTFASIF